MIDRGFQSKQRYHDKRRIANEMKTQSKERGSKNKVRVNEAGKTSPGSTSQDKQLKNTRTNPNSPIPPNPRESTVGAEDPQGSGSIPNQHLPQLHKITMFLIIHFNHSPRILSCSDDSSIAGFDGGIGT